MVLLGGWANFCGSQDDMLQSNFFDKENFGLGEEYLRYLVMGSQDIAIPKCISVDASVVSTLKTSEEGLCNF